MADNFFGFDTDFPSKNVLRSKGLEDEFLTADVEDEYDALNDETFGKAADDDWEEAHEKLTELIKKNNYEDFSVFNDALLENEESQNEIVSKSISQLGLEDDLDDPAIMSISRNSNSLGTLRSSFRSSSSPPPPAILETEDCGSPKTHSIWSATPNDSGISSFIQSLSHGSNSASRNQEPSTPLNSSSDDVFTTPKAWRAEELEKDLLSFSGKDTPSSWPSSNKSNNVDSLSNHCTLPSFPIQNINKIPMDKVLTGEEVERQILSDPRLHLPPPSVTKFIPPPGVNMINPMVPPPQRPPLSSFRPNKPLSLEQFAHFRRPIIANGSVPEHFFLMNPGMGTIMHPQFTVTNSLPSMPSGFNPPNINLSHKMFAPRSINHPFLHKQFQFPMVVHNSYYNREDIMNSCSNMEDEYAGLMTQQEKDWLIRIQINQLKFDNPYLEDYYFVTQVARKCQKKFSENATKNSGKAPEIILPQTTKPENHTYVPIQFEGSLGKLQAVSVNFPRKVLDIKVTRPLEDDEGKVVTNLSLMRYRRLLLDIETMFQYVLEIEDEERRILAKPETEGETHRENIRKLKRDIYSLLFKEKPTDQFQNVLTVRKGRCLVIRVFKLFHKDQQLQCLVSILKSVCISQKIEQKHTFIQNLEIFLDFIQILSFPELVQLGDTFESRFSPDEEKKKIKCSFATAFQNEFGSSVICSMLTHGEKIFTDFHHQNSDIQEKWTKFVVTLSEYMCSSQPSSITPPIVSFPDLRNHFERFVPDKDSFCMLDERLSILSKHPANVRSGS